MNRALIIIMTAAGILASSCSTATTPATSAPPIDYANATFTREFAATGTQKALYNKSLEYIAESFKSATDVIKYQNPEEGKIIGKAVTSWNSLTGNNVFYTFVIEVADGHAKITAKNIYIHTDNGQDVPLWSGTYEGAKKSIEADLANYEAWVSK